MMQRSYLLEDRQVERRTRDLVGGPFVILASLKMKVQGENRGIQRAISNPAMVSTRAPT